ncbi:sugar ABC transporter permease [Mumia zhuanghuii]|uniref:Xylose transport system permease protein XylH n=1 Tax=Mumia zhuanghuii TaxID=2585211 RepID=A0A5C4MC35_9ACTN|nr:sugar ABC transporter permease [Mumia zhuanghuii]TNC35437.1 sugar ABC transporter permease [Mumia zhuanghuii]
MNEPSATTIARELEDQTVREQQDLRGLLAGTWGRIRSGDLGALPVLAGLLIIAVIFQSLNSNFLSPANLVNLLLQSAAVGVIALGIVCVLLVGQIDLSVGSVSGLAAACFATLFVKQGWPLVFAVVGAVAVGAAIGWVYGQVFNRFGVPSFVITLGGLLGFLGLQLFVLGPSGTINLPYDSWLVQFGQLDFVPAWLSYVLVVAASGGYFVSQWLLARERRRRRLIAKSVQVMTVQAVVLLVALLFAVWYLNQSRGVGWMFVFFVALVLVMNYALTRTSWGRHVFAVGGSVEAARRAGINVRRIYTSVFVICSTLAAVGGLLAAGRIAAASQSSGTGDVNLNAIAAAVIGGTSLFGGRGSAFSALLGILVIQSISSGLILLNLSSSLRFMVTGAVLVLAVMVDSLSRRSRTEHGRG